MSYFSTFKLRENIYQFKDRMGVLATLIIGEEKALLVDTCYGIANLKEHVETITDKPLIVVASHGHMDHTGGNYHFKEVFITKADKNLCELHNSEKWRKHSRSIKIPDLEDIGLKITRLDDNRELSDIVYRIHTLLRIIYERTKICKVFASVDDAIIKECVNK